MGVERMRDHGAGIKFVRIAVRGKNDGGFEGQGRAGSAVSGKMKKGKFFRLAGKKLCGSSILTGEFQTLRRREIIFEQAPFLVGLWKQRKIKAGGKRFTDQQQVSRFRRSGDRAVCKER